MLGIFELERSIAAVVTVVLLLMFYVDANLIVGTIFSFSDIWSLQTPGAEAFAAVKRALAAIEVIEVALRVALYAVSNRVEETERISENPKYWFNYRLIAERIKHEQ